MVAARECRGVLVEGEQGGGVVAVGEGKIRLQRDRSLATRQGFRKSLKPQQYGTAITVRGGGVRCERQ